MLYPVYLAVTIDLIDLLIGLLILSGIAALIALATVLFKAARTLGEATSLLKDNKEALTSTIGQLPSVVEKVDNMLEDLSYITEQAGESIPAILGDVDTVSGAAADVVDSVSSLTVGVVDFVDSFISGRGKKSGSSPNIVQQVVTAVGAVKSLAAIFKEFKGKDKKKKKSKDKKAKFF